MRNTELYFLYIGRQPILVNLFLALSLSVSLSISISLSFSLSNYIIYLSLYIFIYLNIINYLRFPVYALTKFIQKHVPAASLVEEIGQEVVFILPGKWCTTWFNKDKLRVFKFCTTGHFASFYKNEEKTILTVFFFC